MRLSLILSRAAKLEQPISSYTAANGDVVSLRRDPLQADPEAIPEARVRLEAVRAVLVTPVDPVDLGLWLYAFAKRVERSPIEGALDAAILALGADLEGMPAACFTDEARKVVALELVFWSSFAKLEPALRRLLAPLETERRRLEAVIAAGECPAPPASTGPPKPPSTSNRDRTPEEIAAIRSTAQAFVRDMAGKVDREGKPALQVQPRYLPKEYLDQLRAACPLVTAARAHQARIAAAKQRSETMNETARDNRAGYETPADNRHEMAGMIRV